MLINVFDKMLRLLHPFMPFVSEEIWQVIRPYLDEPDLAAASAHREVSRARRRRNPLSAAEALAMNHCIEATEAINSLRSLLGWHPGQRVSAVIKRASQDSFAKFETWRPYAMTLANSKPRVHRRSGARTWFSSRSRLGDVGVAAPEGYDFEVAREKLRKQLAEVDKHFSSARSAAERSKIPD